MLNHIWIGSVGIELHEKPKLLYLLAKLWQIRMYGWFSSADDDSFQESDTRGEESEKYLLGNEVMVNPLDLFRKYELGIMTKPTSEIASRSEDDSRDLSWVVQKSCFLDSGELHIMLGKSL